MPITVDLEALKKLKRDIATAAKASVFSAADWSRACRIYETTLLQSADALIAELEVARKRIQELEQVGKRAQFLIEILYHDQGCDAANNDTYCEFVDALEAKK